MSIARRATAALIAVCLVQSATASETDYDRLARDMLEELVAVNTAPSGSIDTRPAVAALVDRLEAAGFGDDEIFVLTQEEPLANLVVRYRSPKPTKKPVLMMAHIDVVEGRPEDWSVPPYEVTEKDGYLYGRGTTDNKAGAAILVANFIRLRDEGFEPNRDLVIMLTADEETTGNAAQWLVTEHRELVDAGFALNTDGGLVMMKNDEPLAFIMQTSEKIYVTYELEALDPGGHSSLPRADNPIYRISRTLAALQAHPFPVSFNETTRAFFERWAELSPPGERELIRQMLDDPTDEDMLALLENAPYYNALTRTTCVATQIEGGHAENALPQTARAVVNCRVLPQSSPDAARAKIEAFAAPNDVTVREIYTPRPSPPSPLVDEVVDPVTAVAHEIWPGIPLIPEMSTGATDGLFVRNAGIPVYAVSAIAEDPDDIRAHGKDERIRIESFEKATAYWYRLTKKLAGGE